MATTSARQIAATAIVVNSHMLRLIRPSNENSTCDRWVETPLISIAGASETREKKPVTPAYAMENELSATYCDGMLASVALTSTPNQYRASSQRRSPSRKIAPPIMQKR